MLSSLFPQWMPPWAQAVLLVGGMLFTLVWLLVPFAVFGVKGRLDNLAIQLDDLQAELRVMSMGLNTPPAPPPASEAASTPPPVTEAPLREPVPPQRRAASPAAGAGMDENDIPAYERRAARARPQQGAPLPVTPPPRPPEPAAPRVRDAAEEWPPRPPAAPRPGRLERDEGPSLSEWSRRPPAGDPDAAVPRPLRASVWPPERGQRAEPTLRWPPRPEG